MIMEMRYPCTSLFPHTLSTIFSPNFFSSHTLTFLASPAKNSQPAPVKGKITPDLMSPTAAEHPKSTLSRPKPIFPSPEVKFHNLLKSLLLTQTTSLSIRLMILSFMIKRLSSRIVIMEVFINRLFLNWLIPIRRIIS
jgi:hypothetical protein